MSEDEVRWEEVDETWGVAATATGEDNEEEEEDDEDDEIKEVEDDAEGDDIGELLVCVYIFSPVSSIVSWVSALGVSRPISDLSLPFVGVRKM